MSKPRHTQSRSASTRALVPLRTRMGRALLWGWSVAGILTVIAALKGAFVPPTERWLVALVIVTYWIVASIAGAILGVLGLYVRGAARKVLLGFLLAMTMFSGAAVAVERGVPTFADSLGILALSAMAGPFFAVFQALLSRGWPRAGRWPLDDHWP